MKRVLDCKGMQCPQITAYIEKLQSEESQKSQSRRRQQMTTPAERKEKIKVENLSLSFSGMKALDNINLDIYENEILAIIGPDGAGKTSLLNVITGFCKPQSGDIYLEGNNNHSHGPRQSSAIGPGADFPEQRA